MSIDSSIVLALSSFGYPVRANSYTGNEQTYFVHNYNTFGENHGDNKPQHERTLIQVHLFCPAGFNSVALRKNVKKKIFDAGFGWPVVTAAHDETGQHWVFEFDKAEGIEYG